MEYFKKFLASSLILLLISFMIVTCGVLPGLLIYYVSKWWGYLYFLTAPILLAFFMTLKEICEDAD